MWDWEDTWQAILVAVIAAFIVFLGVVIFQPKKIDSYYLSSGNNAPGICVYNHWNWHPDERVFCSDDKDTVLEFVIKANGTVK